MTKSTLFLVAALAACAGPQARKPEEFHTSGSREADQRAEQRITTAEQMKGGKGGDGGTDPSKRSLYERLGGDAGVSRIVDDFVDRAVVDPRVNWSRRGVKSGGMLGIGATSAERSASSESVARAKDHVRQFLAVACGGPAKYDGRDMRRVHEGMAITNAEFDAAMGDLKATLDVQRIPVAEQRELLAVLETTRPQIVEER